MELTMTAFAPGMVCSISRFHLMVRCGGSEDEDALKAGGVRGGRGDECFARTHLADHRCA